MGVTIKKYSKSLKVIWNDYVKLEAKTHFFFQRDFMDYHENRHEDHSLMCFQGENIIAVLPANIVGKELHSHQGLTFGGLLHGKIGTAATVECVAAIMEYCKQLGLSHFYYKAIPSIYGKGMNQSSLYALTLAGLDVWRRDISTVVDLNTEIALRKDKKRNFNKGERLGLTIEESTNYEPYWQVLSYVLRKYHQSTPTHSLEEIQQLANSFPENIVLYLLRDGAGKVLGGTVLFIANGVVHTQYMSILEEGRKIGALDYLIVYLMKKYSKTHDYFSFGISTEQEGRVLNEGLIFQKEGFGGTGVVHDFYAITFE